MAVIQLIGGIEFVLAALGVNVFVFMYFVWSPWRATVAGRVLLGFMVNVAIIMDAAIVLGVIAPDNDVIWDWVSAALYLPFTLATWWFVYWLRRSQLDEYQMRRLNHVDSCDGTDAGSS